MPDTLRRDISNQALSAHRILGCEGMSRVDVRLDQGGRPYVLEINTVPGFTSTSLLPKAAAAAGIDFTTLCLGLLDHGLKRADLAALPRWDYSISGRWRSPSGNYRAPTLELV
jgi:D-alanine-D-alanine ligase